ncbi:MAG: 23S rRNA (pseudouridine1915-N3)-methyltransferase [bacterium]|jgi:23S rRNA (pseudouridine1915-N3)-methyltransferase
MKKIRLICIGKTQEKYLQQGIEVFEKKLKHYCSFKIHCLKESNYSRGTQQQWIEEEGDKILKTISPDRITVCCDEKGKLLTSREFASQLSTWGNNGYSEIDFVIGGAFGLSPKVKQSANLVLSFSKFTLTHQMIRLFFTEQLYRAYTIIKNQKYHND